MTPSPRPRRVDEGDNVVPLDTSDVAIVAGLGRAEPWAAQALYDRYARPIERMLRRTLGYERHADLEDLLHDVFVQALGSTHRLRDPNALLAWLRTIATRVAIGAIRRRKARSWLLFVAPEEIPELEVSDPSDEVRQAYTAFYRAVGKLPAVEQVVFTLRYVEGLEVAQVAQACGLPLSTSKRRLAKAEARFAGLARRDPTLSGWMKEGSTWAT